MKNQLSANLLALMNRQSIGGVQLARVTNIPLSTIKNIRKGVNINPTIETLLPLVRYFNVTVEEILSSNLAVEKNVASKSRCSHVEPQAVPIISWEEAVAWPQSDVNDLQIFTEKRCSEYAFALHLVQNISELFVVPGIFLIDPMCKPEHLDYVMVHKFGLARASIKQFIRDEESCYLKSLVITSKLTSFDKSYRLLGVIVEYRHCIKSLDGEKIKAVTSNYSLNEEVTD